MFLKVGHEIRLHLGKELAEYDKDTQIHALIHNIHYLQKN